MKSYVQKIVNHTQELFNSKKFLIYLCLNMVMVWGFMIFLFSREKEIGIFHLVFFFMSLIIIIAQYTPIKNAKNWIIKFFYYFISMLIFLFLVGVLIEPLKGGLFLMVVGSMVAIIMLPIFPSIVLINWLFRRETGLG